MSKNRDLESLIDIYQAATKVLLYTNGLDRKDLNNDPRTLDATLYNIQIIGEATKRISNDFPQAHSHVPWKRMAGMRDKIVHDYNEVDIDLVWRVIQQAIPQLLQQIKSLLPDRSS